jgi:hypothetical protein
MLAQRAGRQSHCEVLAPTTAAMEMNSAGLTPAGPVGLPTSDPGNPGERESGL